MRQIGFYFDQTRCIGCDTCAVACKDWNDVPAGPASWRRVSTIERGTYPHPFVSFLSGACYHCAEPNCVAVCPSGAIVKREEDGVVTVDKQKCREAGRCGIISAEAMGPTFSYGNGTSPCQLRCPAHLAVPGYNALIAKGKFKEALHLIRQRLPLPSVCGRVCLAPCEKECRRQELDRPIAIAALKRFVTDYSVSDPPSPLPKTKQKNVAIVGAGPAGLSAAYDLVRGGYGVTLFEASSAVGGMLVAGIPPYRLPREILQRDIDYIMGLGVQIRTSTPIGPSLTLDDLADQGYGAILLAMGASEGTRPKIPGADLKGTFVATSFLREFSLGKKVSVGKRVVVIGGGNVAIDCGRTALRLGAAEVHVACLESRVTMPATVAEIEEAEQEGIMIHPSVTITRVLGSRTKVTGVNYLHLKGVQFDEDGQPHMDIIEGPEQTWQADTVIFAVGQKPNLSFLGDDKIKISRRMTIAVDTETLATTQGGIFACGDAVNGATNVIEAVASGQRAAFYIDRYLQGHMVKTQLVKPENPSDVKVVIPPDLEKIERQPMPCLPPSQRALNFQEVDLGYEPETAIAEAKRCLNCAGHLCRDVCQYKAPQFGAEEKAKMQKCDLCIERWSENKKPICVDACPVRALDAGLLDDLKRNYGEIREVDGFEYLSELEPSIVFKAKTVKTF